MDGLIFIIIAIVISLLSNLHKKQAEENADDVEGEMTDKLANLIVSLPPTSHEKRGETGSDNLQEKGTASKAPDDKLNEIFENLTDSTSQALPQKSQTAHSYANLDHDSRAAVQNVTPKNNKPDLYSIDSFINTKNTATNAPIISNELPDYSNTPSNALNTPAYELKKQKAQFQPEATSVNQGQKRGQQSKIGQKFGVKFSKNDIVKTFILSEILQRYDLNRIYSRIPNFREDDAQQ